MTEKNYGVTPVEITAIVGNHELRIEKIGCATVVKPVNVFENLMFNIDEKLAWYGGNCGQNYTTSAGCDVSQYYNISRWSEMQYDDSKGGTHPVGLKQPNAYGLYDMLG